MWERFVMFLLSNLNTPSTPDLYFLPLSIPKNASCEAEIFYLWRRSFTLMCQRLLEDVKRVHLTRLFILWTVLEPWISPSNRVRTVPSPCTTKRKKYNYRNNYQRLHLRPCTEPLTFMPLHKVRALPYSTTRASPSTNGVTGCLDRYLGQSDECGSKRDLFEAVRAKLPPVRLSD